MVPKHHAIIFFYFFKAYKIKQDTFTDFLEMLGDVPQFGVPDEEKGNAGKSVKKNYNILSYI